MRRQKTFSRLRHNWQLWLADLPQVDWWLFYLVVGLTALGGLMIRSTELYEKAADGWQHWLFGLIGMVLALFLARWRYESLLQWHWLIYILTNLSLIVVIVMGVSANGAQSWLNIGSFNIQPSEFAKMGLLLPLPHSYTINRHQICFQSFEFWRLRRFLGY